MNNKNKIWDADYIKEKYGTDWRKIDFSNIIVDLEERDLSDITLPEDTEFFQNIHNKSLVGTKFPEADYSIYNFNSVALDCTVFTKGSKLPLDTELFQKVRDKSLYGVVLPRGDYRLYNFDKVWVFGRQFTFDSLLPEYKDFLINLGDFLDGDGVIGGETFSLTENVLRNIHNYDLGDVLIDLSGYSEYISEEQLNIIRIKYKERIGKGIILPEKGLFKENSHALNNDKNLII